MFIDFRESGRERERNINVREKHQLVAFHMCPDRGLNPNLGLHPDQESNPQAFSIWDDVPIN